ncbi:MAG: 23S rRNA (uracil(1939)-C(5))-methyltransferase RlmD [Ignavibacteria bacterium]
MIKKNDELVVKIFELSSEGKGVSKLDDGFVIFSEGTLPGDEALVQIRKKKSNFAEAKLIEIVKRSEFRIDPRCSYFGICGGCKIQNYEYSKQLEYKTKVVKDAFERIGKFTGLTIPDALGSEEIFFYRNKMEFSFSDDEWVTLPSGHSVEDIEAGKFALGLHVPKFYSKIINIEQCFLQSEISNDILNFTRDFFKSRSISVYSTKTQQGFLRFLIVRQSRNTGDLMVNIITYDHDKELIEEYSEGLQTRIPQITTIINSVSQSKAQVARGEKEFVISGNGYINEKLRTGTGKEYSFKISPASFFQTNTLQAEKLFNVLTEFGEFSDSDNVLDLYCGAGSISIFISGMVNKVLGIEIIEDSIIDARKNAQLNNVANAEFMVSDIKDFLESELSIQGYNQLILDPPRSGLHPKICDILSDTNFEKIIYVSCNPHTQARDLQIICGHGKYLIDRVQPVDMFPHTYHIENVVSLVNDKNWNANDTDLADSR